MHRMTVASKQDCWVRLDQPIEIDWVLDGSQDQNVLIMVRTWRKTSTAGAEITGTRAK